MENFLEALFKNQVYDKNNFFLIAGPCVVEGESIVLEIAEKVAAVCKHYEVPYILKASYKKANRTSASSFTGIGDPIVVSSLRIDVDIWRTGNSHPAFSCNRYGNLSPPSTSVHV